MEEYISGRMKMGRPKRRLIQDTTDDSIDIAMEKMHPLKYLVLAVPSVPPHSFFSCFMAFFCICNKREQSGSSMESLRPPVFCNCMSSPYFGSERWSNVDENLDQQLYVGLNATNANAYNPGVLVGNYNEERYDLKQIKKRRPLPSQYAQYYQRTYAEAYNRSPLHRYPNELNLLKRRLPHIHPILQPELETEIMKAYLNSWQTTQRASFLHPCLRLQPIKGEPNKSFTCQ